MKRGLLLCASLTICTWVSALTVNVAVQDVVCSTLGSCYAYASGGVPPYSYVWSTGGTTEGIYGLGTGTYSVTVTDAVSTQATGSGTVGYRDHTQSFELNFPAGVPMQALCVQGVFNPFFYWGPSWMESFPPPPYTFNGNSPVEDGQGSGLYIVHIPAPSGQAAVMQFLDGDGCPGTFEVIAGYTVGWPQVTVLDVQGACTGTVSGSVTVAYTEEDHQYPVTTEVRDMADNIVILGGGTWHGQQPTTQVYSGLAPGDYRLIQRLTVEGDYYMVCNDEVLVTIPDLGPVCGNVNGRVYMDYNTDCIMGPSASETRVPNAVIEFTPGPYYAATNSTGAYSVDLPLGTYTMQQLPTGVAQHCPAPPNTITVASGIQTVNLADTALVPLDAQVMMVNGPARPGFELHYAIRSRNLTPAGTGAITVTFTFDPTVSFIYASPTPSTVNGNVLTWNQSALGAFTERHITVRLQVPSDVALIGYVLDATAELACANPDADPGNNTSTSSVTITGSYDPNDKLAQTSSRSSQELYYIDEDEWIDYTIRFQNTGTDTAFNVVITDTLPPTLNPSSIVWGAGTHTHTRSLSGQGVLTFTFPNILLPDSNVNEPKSHGAVGFRIKPYEPVLTGTVIENIANIYFDFNPPVITEPSVLLAEFSTGVQERSQDGMRLMPNPVSDELRISATGSIEVLRIIAADGREVLARSVRATNASIAVDRLQAGAYLLIATFTDGTEARERFIKQ